MRERGKGAVQYIRYTGEGEPLVHPKCYEILDYAVQNSGTLVALTTNGTILNEKRVEKLLAAGLDLIDISIDAFKPETYAKIRVNGELEVTRGNVLRMIQMAHQAGRKTRVVVSFIEQPQNIGEAEDFERFWKDEGADQVVVRRLHSGAGTVVMLADILRKEGARVQRRPCLYPWERIVLNPRGKLSFCPQDWVHGSEVADYTKTTIGEVWQSDFYANLRKAHIENNYSEHKFCGNCPDWRQTRWPGHGRSYADMMHDLKGTS